MQIHIFSWVVCLLCFGRVFAYNAASCKALGGNCQYDPVECGPCDDPSVRVINKCQNSQHWALTFDDGPTNTWTQVLDQLDAKGVKATFFVLGTNIAGNEAMLRRIHAAGHQIGNHAFSHNSLKGMTDDSIRTELDTTWSAIQSAVGATLPRYFRPPLGEFTDDQRVFIQSMGWEIVMWNVDVNDWMDNTTATSLVNQVVREGRIAGSKVMLEHGANECSYSTVSAQVDAIVSAGYTPVRIDECHTGGDTKPPVNACATNNGGCDPAHGVCSLVSGSVQCSCAAGYLKDLDESCVANPCASSPCSNGATCRSNTCRYFCRCPPAFTGPRCTVAVSTSSTGISFSSTAKPIISSTAKPIISSTAKPISSTAKPIISSTAKPISSTAKPIISSTAKPIISSTATPTSSTATPATTSGIDVLPVQNCGDKSWVCEGKSPFTEQPLVPWCPLCCCNWGLKPKAGSCGCQ